MEFVILVKATIKSYKYILFITACGISLGSSSWGWTWQTHRIQETLNHQRYLSKVDIQATEQYYVYGKEWVGGGGIIENEFVMVWNRRGAWANACLASPNSCQLNENETQTLKQIFSNLQGPELLFGSFSQFPEIYPHQLGPEGLVATHPILQSQVYVNTDLLYAKGPDPLSFRGVQRPITHLYAALLYQVGIPLMQSFAVSSKVAYFWGHHEMIKHLGSIGLQDLNVTYFQNDPVMFFINDHRSMNDVTPWLQKQLPCEKQNEKALLRQLKNTSWRSIERHGSTIEASLKGSIVYTCVGSASQDFKADLNIYLLFKESNIKPGYFVNAAEDNRADIYYQ